MMRTGRTGDWENPLVGQALLVRANDRDPICGSHQGQWPYAPRKQAGHMTCTRPQAESQNPLTRGRRPHMTPSGPVIIALNGALPLLSILFLIMMLRSSASGVT